MPYSGGFENTTAIHFPTFVELTNAWNSTMTTDDYNSTEYGLGLMYDWINATIENSTSPFPYQNEPRTISTSVVFYRQETALHRFSDWYQQIHGYVSVLVCVFGIIANIMNIAVLTQKNMVSSTNVLLTALAVADMLTMISYLPNAIYFYCIADPEQTYGHPQGWVIYLVFNTNFIITWHTIAMWLTVALAVFRYIVVCHRNLGPTHCTIRRAILTIAAILTVTPVFCIPNYMIHSVELDNNTGIWWIQQNDFVSPYHLVFNFWLFGVVLKVAPCVLLTVLSALLIRAMKIAETKRRALKSQGCRLAAASEKNTGENNRTTTMLVAVVLCFVVTELPQGVLAFLSGIHNEIFQQVYTPLGDIWDIIVLVNSAANFIVYCTMSRQFRNTFSDVFLKHSCQGATVKDTARNRTALLTNKSRDISAQYCTVNTLTTKI